MTAAMREVMLAADGAGDLSGDEVRRGRAEHPVCGDVLELAIDVRHGVIRDLAWRADGCPATIAVAACARSALRDAPLADAEVRLRARLQQLGGLDAHEQHAERMLLRALRGGT